MTKAMANITVQVNQSAIKKEKRNGRDVWIVPSKTMPRDIVMNNIMYSGEEIERSYQTLERTPAPFGHPKIDGIYVSASDPEAINTAWIGAYNEDVTWDGDRLSVNKVIDVEVAGRTENGKRVIAALEKGEPISTSTGIFMEIEDLAEPATNSMGQEYSRVAKDMIFNHDALLLDEPPAASPEQGTGIFVNQSGERMDVVNSRLDMLNDEIEYSLRNTFELIESSEREKRQESKWANVKSKLVDYMKSLVQLDDEKADGLSVNHDHEEDVMSEIKREEFDALVTKVDTLVSNAEKAPSVSEQITEALKPVVEQMQANAEADKAKAKAEHDKAVEAVVNAEIFPKEIAEKMELDALNASIDKFGKPSTAYGVNGSFVPNGGKFDADALAPEA